MLSNLVGIAMCVLGKNGCVMNGDATIGLLCTVMVVGVLLSITSV